MNQRHHFVKAFANAKSFPKRSPEEQARFSKAIDQAINEDITKKARLEREGDRTVKPAVTKSQLNSHTAPFTKDHARFVKVFDQAIIEEVMKDKRLKSQSGHGSVAAYVNKTSIEPSYQALCHPKIAYCAS
jgi:hypothetical protein